MIDFPIIGNLSFDLDIKMIVKAAWRKNYPSKFSCSWENFLALDVHIVGEKTEEKDRELESNNTHFNEK